MKLTSLLSLLMHRTYEPNAEIKAWNPDTNQYESVTGIVIIGEGDNQVLELQTDEP